MRKVLLNSEDEYIRYCTEHNVGKSAVGDCVKPVSYPCVMVWEWFFNLDKVVERTCVFVYMDDFSEFNGK